jgi:hypothetical protein
LPKILQGGIVLLGWCEFCLGDYRPPADAGEEPLLLLDHGAGEVAMTALRERVDDLPRLIAHPLTIAVSCAGSALFAVLSYHAALSAIPPDCMRTSLIRALLPALCMGMFAFSLIVALGGIFHRLQPNPSWASLAWAPAIGQSIMHAAMFALCAAVYAAADVPAGCGSPSFVELGIIGLGQLAHIAFLMRRAARVAAWAREDV